jgi:multidrug efflux pump subunit AcrB
MKNLVNYFIKYPILGNLLMLLILIFGTMGMANIRSTFFPQAPIRNISIQVVYPNASPEEIEESVVLKIEDKLRGVSGVERVTSVSSENLGSLDVEIRQNADVEIVLQDVKNNVDQINSFPLGLESINVYKLEVVNTAVSFAIKGSEDLRELKTIATRIERDLLNIQGISKVSLSGFPDEEISIELKEDKLRAYGISLEQVLDRIRSTNIEATGGTIKGSQEELKIRLKNKSYFAKDLKEIYIISSLDGRLVKLSEIAEVNDKWAEAPDRNYLNGSPSVAIDVRYTNDEDLLSIVQDVRGYIKGFNKQNEFLAISVINDQSKVVQERIDMLTSNGILGFFIVLILLAIFLHYRLAFWVALSIPISFAGMFILATFFDVTLNVISLFGMITVIGILVDDGVIVSENIYRHFEMGKGRIRSAIEGTLEVVPAVFSAILTTIIVFSTFFFIEGRLGDFFGQMAFIVIATLIFSLVEGILILPAHVAHSKALDRNVKSNRLMVFFSNFMEGIKNKFYLPILTFSLKNPAFALSVPIGLFIITMGAMRGGVISSTFFPSIEQDNIVINLKMPAGTSQSITKENLDKIELAIWEANEYFKSGINQGNDLILSSDKRIGPGSAHKGSIKIELLGGEQRGVKQLEVSNYIRQLVGEIPGSEEFSFGSGSPFGKPISVALRGDDMDDLREVVQELTLEMKNLSDLSDITDSDLQGAKEVRIVLKEKAYLLGFTETTIISQIRRGFYGGEVQRVQRGLDEIRIWVRYDLDQRSTVKQLKDIEILSNSGDLFLLSDLVDFSILRGNLGINHTNGKREILVESNLSNSDVSTSDMVANLSQVILPRLLQGKPNIEFSFEGQGRQQAKSQASVEKVFPIILLLMIAVIICTFRSISQTLIVVLLIPFGFIGVAWGHYLHGMQVSLFSMLGTIALIGILINDSLVFVSAFNHNIKNRIPYNDALMRAAMGRFRPILLTSVTTIAGLAPLILEKSFQAQFLIPMALSIAYGLAFATIVILVLLPVLLQTSNQTKSFFHWWWNDKIPDPEFLEPAFKELKYENLEDFESN